MKTRHVVLHPNTKNEALCGDSHPRIRFWKFARRFWPYGDVTRPLCPKCVVLAALRIAKALREEAE